MKKFLPLLAAIFILLPTGCRKDVDREQIIGRWEGYEMHRSDADDGPSVSIRYTPGEFIITIDDNAISVWRNGKLDADYKYRYNEKRRLITATGKDGRAQTAKVVRQKGSKLELHNDGCDYYFRAAGNN